MLTKKQNDYYKPESAGRLINKNVPIALKNYSIGDIEKILITGDFTFEHINYIYIVEENKKLIGVISIKELFRAPKNTLAIDFFKRDLITVRTHTDQERVALLAIKHNLKEVPVVSKVGKFIGVVPFDEILKIIDTEGVEDVLRMGGIYHKGKLDNILHLTTFESIKHRLPWLLFGLGGGFCVAGIIKSFENIISQNLILTAFIPLVVYMASAVGIQMEAFVIRDLAVNPNLKFSKYFFKQFLVVCIIGIVTANIFFLLSYFLYGVLKISIAVSIALFIAVMSSVTTGLTIPYLFGKLKLDPANASGPVATIMQDLLSVIIYFSIASFMLK